MTKKSKTILIFFIFGVIAFTLGLYSQEFIQINCRYGLFAYEMNLSNIGPFPILYGQPYADYPSLHVILISLVSKLLGVNMLSVTLPSAIAGAGILVFTYLIGEKHSRRFGLFATFLLLISYQFLALSRAPSPDIFVAFLGVLSFYLVYSADLEKKYFRLLLLPLLAFLGFAIRGPIGTVIPSAIVFAYYLTGRKFKLLIATGMLNAVMLLCGVGIFAYWAFLCGGEKLVEEFATNQLFGRFPGHKPFWFYFSYGIAAYSLSFPLAMLVMGTYLYVLRRKYFKTERCGSYAHLRQVLTIWIFIVVLGLSIPGDKHLRYIVSIVPATALLAAFIFENPDKIKFFDKVKSLFINLARFTPFILIIMLLLAAGIFKILDIHFPLPLLLPSLLFFLLGLIITFYHKKVPPRQYAVFILCMIAIGIIAVQVVIIEPINQYLESSKALVAKTEEIRPINTPVCFYGLGPDGDELRYLVNIDRSRTFTPVFVPYLHPEKLLSLSKKNMPIIAKESKIKFISPDIMKHLHKISKGNLGHRKCRVFLADIYNNSRK